MGVRAHVAEGSAAEAPLIELAVITGVAAGFPGIYSPTEPALPARGFHPYVHTHRFTDTRSQISMRIHMQMHAA